MISRRLPVYRRSTRCLVGWITCSVPDGVAVADFVAGGAEVAQQPVGSALPAPPKLRKCRALVQRNRHGTIESLVVEIAGELYGVAGFELE